MIETPSSQSIDTATGGNVDPAEVAKFQAIASRWWDPTSEFRPLHEINPLRLGWIEDLAGGLAARKVVDVGCGGGILAESMAWKDADVLGIDLADKALSVAELHALETGARIRYERIAVEALADRESGAYDVVTCMEMLEHVPEPDKVVQACARLVRPGGHVFFSTISRNAKAFLFAVVGAEYVLKLLPRGTHEYDKFIKPSELIGSARRHGLQLEAMTGLTYNPLTRQYRLDPKDVSVNYMIALQRVDGDA
ncbi:MAG: bifunctional 2-polyprenyl-6-hydroxyphenol methylase/3-demethylubiquinol 3-O-methyltransferase UbiG [Burkholderiaceae bacterium]